MRYGYDDGDDPLGLLCAIVIGGVIFLSLVFSCLGCTSVKACPECIPEVQTVEVKIPVYSCPPTEDLPPLVLPAWPVLPEGADEGQLKEFYSDCVATLHARERALLEYIELVKANLQ